jgi:hypothetical protein
MTIYGRAGDVVTLKRLADSSDVLRLEGREPDERDLAALKSLSYFVVAQDDGTEALHHVAYLRATGGAREINEVVDDLVLRAIASAPARHPPTHVVDQAGQPYGSERRCCNQCGAMATPGMIIVESVAEWWDLPPERRCDRSRATEAP